MRAGTAPDFAARLSHAIDAVLKPPAVARRMQDLGAIPVGGAAGDLAAFQCAEQDK